MLAGVATGLVVVLVGGLLTAMQITLVSVDRDTGRLVAVLERSEDLLESQLASIQAQLAVLESSRDIQAQARDEVTRTRETAEQLLATAQATLAEAERARAAAQQTLEVTRAIKGDTDAGVRAAREAVARADALLAVAREVRDDVREINRRTGGAGTGGPLP